MNNIYGNIWLNMGGAINTLEDFIDYVTTTYHLK